MLFWIVAFAITIPICLLLAWEAAGNLGLLPGAAPWDKEDWD